MTGRQAAAIALALVAVWYAVQLLSWFDLETRLTILVALATPAAVAFVAWWALA